jgi:hypothetical protein
VFEEKQRESGMVIDSSRRMMMFESMRESILMNAAEICERKEQEEV